MSPILGAVKPAGESFGITGTATSPSGVTRVQVEVQNRDTKQFLQDNLTSWGGNNNILATLAATA